MQIIEIITENQGICSGKELHTRIGTGRTFANLGDWIGEMTKAGITVRDVSSTIVVPGIDNLKAYETTFLDVTSLTIFEIT